VFNKTDYWLELCDDDLRTAKNLLNSKDYLWMGFICHLIAEKSIKAVLANITDEIPPKIHDLQKLAHIAGIYPDLTEKQNKLLKDLMPMHIEARYPEYKRAIAATLSDSYCTDLLKETEAFLCWIKQKLGK
jgi:HEPN domain-containing protein